MSLRPDSPANSEGWTTAEWTKWLAEDVNAVCSILPDDAPICGRCRRPMKVDDDGSSWPRCWPCNNTYRDLTRVVAPISYSASGGLTGLVAQAKEEPDRWWVRFGLASLLYSFLTTHLECLERFAHGSFDYATVVPSHPSRRGGRDHLKELVGTVSGGWPGVPWQLDLLTKTRPSVADERRQTVDKDLFVADARVNLAGRRVLLVDDLYTSGSTSASAAHALVAAGSDPPVVVTIGRHLAPGDDAAVEFVRKHHLENRGYVPQACVLHGRSPSPFANRW